MSISASSGKRESQADMRIYDISEPISPATAVFPGDNGFTAEWVMRMADGASCNVSTLRMSAHCGSHSDAPLHYSETGADAASMDLQPYLGRCRVITVASVDDPPVVDAESLSGALDGVERVLLRTSQQHDAESFDPNFTALGPAAAQRLVDAGMKLVGIDAQSMDHATCKDLKSHNILREGSVSLLENLDLSAAPDGDFELIALPLKIVGGDAAPVRAILRELT
ncbi:MAG: cyclase family protein [Planctomycetota bacterium]|nr:cyclase family protein [Planctomycetota bacterium]